MRQDVAARDVVVLQEYNTRCSGATKCRRRRPGRSLRSRAMSASSQYSSYRPPSPPFFDKHALKIGEDSLRVTITPKNVMIPILKKFFKNGKHF